MGENNCRATVLGLFATGGVPTTAADKGGAVVVGVDRSGVPHTLVCAWNVPIVGGAAPRTVAPRVTDVVLHVMGTDDDIFVLGCLDEDTLCVFVAAGEEELAAAAGEGMLLAMLLCHTLGVMVMVVVAATLSCLMSLGKSCSISLSGSLMRAMMRSVARLVDSAEPLKQTH